VGRYRPGVSGNPRGKPKGRKTSPEAKAQRTISEWLRFEIQRLVLDAEDNKKRPNGAIIARTMVRQAKAGDVPATNLVMDRTEGKVSTASADADGFNLLEFIHRSYELEAERKAAALKEIPMLEAKDVESADK
jgi:hypothetical protein